MPIYVPSILERQRLGVKDGRIRAGYSTMVMGKKGKLVKKPHTLEHWRFTSPSEYAIEVAAELFGGGPRPWGRQWEVFTKSAEVPVLVCGGQPVSQWMELWEGNVCLRRCTGGKGAVNTKDGKPCSCPADDRERKELAQYGQACKPKTRFFVRFIDVPGIGQWGYFSDGENAAVDLPQGAAVLEQAVAADVLVPATLMIVKVEEGGKHYVIPRLDFKQSIGQMALGKGVGTLRELAAGAVPLALPVGRQAALPPARGGTPAQPRPAAQAQPAAPPEGDVADDVADDVVDAEIVDDGDEAAARRRFAQKCAERAMRNEVGRDELINFCTRYKDDPCMGELVDSYPGVPRLPLREVLARRLDALSPPECDPADPADAA